MYISRLRGTGRWLFKAIDCSTLDDTSVVDVTEYQKKFQDYWGRYFETEPVAHDFNVRHPRRR